ncbi:MAG: hypothetical protein ACYCR4_11050 [Acidimicrobiales bacterium]
MERHVVGGRVALRRVLVSSTSSTCASEFAPVPEMSTYWAFGVPGSYGNTGAGSVADCTIAAAADLEQIFTASARPLPVAPWMAAYTALLAAEDPGEAPGSSAGLSVSSVLAAWQHGGIAGTKVGAVSPVTLGRSTIEAALERGPLYAVVDLPAPVDPGTSPLVDSSYVALSQWSPGLPGSGYFVAGPHALAVVGFDRSSVFLETWGYIQPVTWSWWAAYASQAFSVVPAAPAPQIGTGGSS